MTRYGALSPGPVFHWLMNTRSSSSVEPGEMKPPYGCASRLSSGGPNSSAGSGHSPAKTTVVTGAVPRPVGSAATRTSILPVLALKYDSTVWPSICRTLISPTRSDHNGVGGFPQPPCADQPCQLARSVNVCGLARYSTGGPLRSKLLATMYTQPLGESGFGIGS